MGFPVSQPTYIYQSRSGYIFRIRVPHELESRSGRPSSGILFALVRSVSQSIPAVVDSIKWTVDGRIYPLASLTKDFFPKF